MINNSQSLLTKTAINYVYQQFFQRMGIFDFQSLGISMYYAKPYPTDSENVTVFIIPCKKEAWHTLLNREANTLDWLPIHNVFPHGFPLPFHDSIPILFWGEGYENNSKHYAEKIDDKTVVFYADIIVATFFMLTRWEETIIPIRDQHERFPATASVAYKQGFLDRPIVDEYTLILQAWLKVLLPQWNPTPPQFSVKLSHDIDQVRCFDKPFRGIRKLGGDIIKRWDIKQAYQTLIDLTQQVLFPKHDIYFQGIYFLAELSKQYTMDSAFYFKSSEWSEFDTGYNPCSPLIKACIADLQEQGFEVGFHPSYYTLNNPTQLAKEKQYMDMVLGQNKYGGRQHYLRFHVPNTWQHWEQLGLTYDSTLGYADHEGFRCGTCHPFQVFDIKENRILNLWEIPLIVMEGTLKQYRQLSPIEGENEVLKLAQRCKQVNGTFTLLWHNSSLHREWQTWGEMYQSVIPKLAKMEGKI